MNAATKAQYAAIEELTDYHSDLSRRGTDICKRIEYLTDIPTYYYLYRVGGESLSQEQQRRCPGCSQKWSQPQPIHNIFDFKCDNCRLVSNLSWDFQ